MTSWSTKLTELRGTLTELYPEKEEGKMLVDMAGIPSGSIAFSDKAQVNWHNILKEANKRSKVRDIVQIAIQEYPEREELPRLFTEVEEKEPLISAVTLARSVEKLKPPKRSRSVIGGSQPVTLPDAPQSGGHAAYDILVPNREGLEKIVKGDDLIDIISWVQGAMEQSKTVCKIETAAGASGTGFLLKGGLLMTNHHVIPDRDTAANTRVVFNYKTDIHNNVLQQTYYRLDPSAVFITSQKNELDYTLVKVADTNDNPLSDWGHVQLETFFDPQVDEKVTVIQHPLGKYMKMALPDNIISIWGKYLFYTTDTQEGSSGSPVFNKHWKVVALHHAGRNEQSFEGGLQINDTGTIAPSNRGIRIKYILEDLKRYNFSLPQ
ncbi:V8-like Glu-specific endopeptidase [Lewinella aquimaris]|uniref:V8-like Glu-specific endopeptidase n=1 Tax=Neolewinella aquimaris TaxID=1835722 RepID=A0A840E6Z8_9BACT|nr:trypsin-like peptidase domain-containing protein [Neolewinella aquimaris]MBB4080941.1 V8-like Glu-specific endopeptidase [Neolewinella aquimaris]